MVIRSHDCSVDEGSLTRLPWLPCDTSRLKTSSYRSVAWCVISVKIVHCSMTAVVLYGWCAYVCSQAEYIEIMKICLRIWSRIYHIGLSCDTLKHIFDLVLAIDSGFRHRTVWTNLIHFNTNAYVVIHKILPVLIVCVCVCVGWWVIKLSKSVNKVARLSFECRWCLLLLSYLCQCNHPPRRLFGNTSEWLYVISDKEVCAVPRWSIITILCNIYTNIIYDMQQTALILTSENNIVMAVTSFSNDDVMI